MAKATKSLQFRIVLLSGIWIILVLAGISLVLLHTYQEHIERHYDAHVQMHMEEMVSAASLDADGNLHLAYAPSDPRFQVPYSGWYWEIIHDGEVLARSPSLLDHSIDLGHINTAEHSGAHVVNGPDGKPLRVQATLIPAGVPGQQLLLVASAPMMGITDDVGHVGEHFVTSFTILGICLLVAVLIQIRLALKPVNDIGRGISRIHVGTADKLSGDFPREVQPLVDELNNLLEHNSTLLRRARNQLGDLAHSIKNPLTVINNEAREMQSEKGQLIIDQTSAIADSMEHHLTRARAYGTDNVLGARAKVRTVAEDLVFALKRIYKARELDIDFSALGKCTVRCEAQDLEEMLGNLMDNACKWVAHRIFVRCERYQGRCRIYVEDDGPGIPEDKIGHVMQRGQRLDESREGHGLGLGIVQDIAELYNGKLMLGRSEYGGLSARLDLPGG